MDGKNEIATSSKDIKDAKLLADKDIEDLDDDTSGKQNSASSKYVISLCRKTQEWGKVSCFGFQISLRNENPLQQKNVLKRNTK